MNFPRDVNLEYYFCKSLGKSFGTVKEIKESGTWEGGRQSEEGEYENTNPWAHILLSQLVGSRGSAFNPAIGQWKMVPVDIETKTAI